VGCVNKRKTQAFAFHHRNAAADLDSSTVIKETFLTQRQTPYQASSIPFLPCFLLCSKSVVVVVVVDGGGGGGFVLTCLYLKASSYRTFSSRIKPSPHDQNLTMF